MGKVLIVEDNIQNREIIEDLLSTWGYSIYTAVDGFEAFDLACKYNPDVIILDVMLPGMNGYEVCRKIKNNAATENIPIIMLTVLNEVEDRIRGFNVGADVFLSKPIIYQELKNRVEWAMNSKKVYDNMENANEVTKSFLKIIKLKNNNLYLHACNVKNYCEKVGKILSVTDEEMEHLLIGAYLHDIGKIVSTEGEEHVKLGVDIISSLKMCRWLKVFVKSHHEKINGQGFPDGLMGDKMTLELKILIIINRFVELWEQFGNKDTSIIKLSDECKKGYWSIEILEAIKQVLKDESFIKSINFNK
jgi:putative two-component system response regulator